jgi:hypothetical protein
MTYGKLYTLAENRLDSKPFITSEKMLKTLLQDMYDDTPLKKVERLIMLMDLLKVVMNSFIIAIEKLNQYEQQINSITLEIQKYKFSEEVKTIGQSFSYIEDGWSFLEKEAADIIRKHSNVRSKFVEDVLHVKIPNTSFSDVKNLINDEITKAYGKDEASKINYESVFLENVESKKLSGKIIPQECNDAFGTIEAILYGKDNHEQC